MKVTLSILGFILFGATAASAAPTLITGIPSNSYFSAPTGPAPSFGTLFNFDLLTPGSLFVSSQYSAQGVTISSPGGLMVVPYSTQSSPNELLDTSAGGSANITIQTSLGRNQIGVGVADSDSISLTLQGLSSTGSGFGPVFSVSLPTGGSNPGNGYFILSDTSSDLYGLQILQGTGNPNFSGLAIDDLQVSSSATPEPANLALLGTGAVLLAMGSLRKRS